MGSWSPLRPRHGSVPWSPWGSRSAVSSEQDSPPVTTRVATRDSFLGSSALGAPPLVAGLRPRRRRKPWTDGPAVTPSAPQRRPAVTGVRRPVRSPSIPRV
jgi:hypothetical protein